MQATAETREAEPESEQGGEAATSVLGINTDVAVATAVEAVGERRRAELRDGEEREATGRQFRFVASLAAAVDDGVEGEGFRLRPPNYYAARGIKRLDAVTDPGRRTTGELRAEDEADWPDGVDLPEDRTVGEVLDRVVATGTWDGVADEPVESRTDAAETLADYAGGYVGRDARGRSGGPRVMR